MNIYYADYDFSCFSQKNSTEEKNIIKLLRSKLLDYAFVCEKGKPYSEFFIEYNQYGKPLIKNNDFYFNISHTRGFIICAVSDFPIGVDCELIRPFNKAITNKVMSEAERTELLSNSNIEELFFKYWTLKESYIKMIGTGLSYTLYKINFSFEHDQIISNANNINFYSLQYNNYAISVASSNNLTNVKLESVK